jgi:hypothetical protein
MTIRSAGIKRRSDAGSPARHPRPCLHPAPLRQRERDGEILRVSRTGPLVASAIEIESAAAVASLGLIHTFEDALRAPLEQGHLLPVLPD